MAESEGIRFLAVKISSVKFFIEEFCVTFSLASDASDDPEDYLILTREVTDENSGDPMDEPWWDMQVDEIGPINTLEQYRWNDEGALTGC